jgi:hypothetical protein
VPTPLTEEGSCSQWPEISARRSGLKTPSMLLPRNPSAGIRALFSLPSPVKLTLQASIIFSAVLIKA